MVRSSINSLDAQANFKKFSGMAQALEKMSDNNLTTNHFTPEDVANLQKAEEALRALKASERKKLSEQPKTEVKPEAIEVTPEVTPGTVQATETEVKPVADKVSSEKTKSAK